MARCVVSVLSCVGMLPGSTWAKKLSFIGVSFVSMLVLNTTSAQSFFRVEDQAGLGHLRDMNGVAVADYDKDGDLDVFCVGYWSFDYFDETSWSRLLRNNGDATFEDVTLQAGFDHQFVNTGIEAARGEKMGAAWGDYDNDGYPDLFLTNSREDQLYHNEGDGTFVDVTQQAGVVGCNSCYSASGLWWDHDRDGDLDLYVSIINGSNIMYENKGDGTFKNITQLVGLGGAGITWTSVAIDVDGDGFLDLYNVNDTQENQLFVSREGTGFFEFAGSYGLADEGAGMGITIGDYNNDGLFDFYITNIFSHHPNPLYTHLPEQNYRDDAPAMGVDNAGWGWGTKFFDCDHDGDEDLYAVTGVEEKQYINNELQTDVDNFFFKNLLMEGTQNFVDWSTESATDGSARARGLETFDFDDDGDLDLLVGNSRDKIYLYRNEIIQDEQPEARNWIKIWLEGTTSNRDALGSVIKLTADGKSYYRWHHGAGFLGQSLQPVHFGLSSTQVIDEIQVTWPTGAIEKIYNVPTNQTLLLKEGDNTMVTSVEEEHEAGSFEAYNYPNPFDHSTTLHFGLAKPGVLDLRIFSISGKEVFQMRRTQHRAGPVEINWEGTDKSGMELTPGVYFYSADFEGHRVSGRMVKASMGR